MITILTTTKFENDLQKVIDSIPRLNELVTITTNEDELEIGKKRLYVNEREIACYLDWFDTEPPYLFPTIAYSTDALLAMVYYKLGNEQRAFEHIDESNTLFFPLLVATKIKFGYELHSEVVAQLSGHNRAIVNHYGVLADNQSFEEIKALYESILQNEHDDEVQCYTAKHYANLLLDAQKFGGAAALCAKYLKKAPNKNSKMALRMLWATAKTKGLQLPYNEMELLKIATVQVKCIDFLQEHGFDLNAALLAMDAADVSNFLSDYPTAKAYINLAIKIFKEHDLNELLGEAGLKKATLLYNWSKNGSPQYYKASINAFQDTLKIFKRDSHPAQFAEVHHSLALIYSEIPASPEEKPMWIAFSASSFKEALTYFKEDEFPYEHAMVCHNYATALIDFPPAKLHNNHEKANDMFHKALSIRTAKEYPTERALTLLNHIELGWLMHNENEKMEETRLNQMKAQAEEVLELVNDVHLQEKAKEQLNRLEALKELI